VGCFPLAKPFRKSPAELAKAIAEAISTDDLIQAAVPAGPYINFKLSNRVFFGDTITEIVSAGVDYGESRAGEGQRVMVEYLSPNTNKPLHRAHLRNAPRHFGIAAARPRALVGQIHSNNNRCTSAKCCLGRWKRRDTGVGRREGDHFVGKWYVRCRRSEDRPRGTSRRC
jgi:arginyl-tRNA synthetase